MRGGRGYRGGYRGSSRGISDSSGGGGWRGGKSSYTNSSRGGGYSTSSRGGYSKWEKETGSVTFDSRPRYSSGGGGTSGAGGGGSSGVGAAASDLYSSGSRGDERSYRYSREGGSTYGRNNSYRGSSPDRKRMRTEYSPATSAHRSHESGYGDVNDYMNRSYSGYGGDMESKRMSRGYSGDRRSFYREERERTRSNDYQYTKPVASLSVTPRRSSTRGSLRGRTFSKSREVRGGFRRSDSYKGAIAKKRALSESYAVRKRMLSGRTQEYLRRLKLYRLRRLEKAERYRKVAGDKKDDKGENKSEDGEEEEYEEIEEEEEEECEVEEGAEDEAEHDESKEEGEKQKKGDEEVEEGEANGVVKKEEGEEKKKKKVKKVIRIRKVKRKVPVKKEGDSKMDVDENKPEGVQVTIKQDSDSRAVNDDVSAKKSSSNPFIKLECPHCHVRCVTFKQYNNHLHTSKHMAAMSALTLQLRKTLARMRAEQRDEQRIIDDECKEKNMNMSTFFCTICKLNYRSPKAEHQASVRHKELRDFLLPYCHVCRITFRSPMLHEAHICQLDHIRRKANLEKRLAEKEAEVKDVDMDNFMILDSVGSGEESAEAESEEEKEEQDKTDGEKEAKKKKKKKSEVKLGAEHCKKVEVYYCDLCRIYLPRLDDIERSLVLHCRSRNHLYLYVRYRDDQALRKRAERLHRLREEEKKLKKEEEESKKAKEEEEKGKEDGDKTKDGSPSKVKPDSQMDDADGMDEKMWSEVDKDIGDLLREVEPGNKSSDEDDDSRAEDGGRYDRFKHSEKEKSKRNIKVDDDEEDDSLIRNENTKGNEKNDEDAANAVEKDDQ